MSMKKLSIMFKSSIDNLTSINSSFDKGVLRVAYHGKNNNGSYISRETFEECVDTIYNCPVVCNYMRDSDSIGQHDIEIVRDDDGIRLVNITQPVGVVPESATWRWDECEEANGEIHEYLCVDVIVWKRQEAYKKIKGNGITDESMEINIKSGKHDKNDGLFHITSFEFNAFCLLESASPCFESAGLDMFSLNDFRSQYVDMMDDFKKEFCDITSVYSADINKNNENNTNGGMNQLSEKDLLLKYGLSESDVDFDLSVLSESEMDRKFSELKNKKDESEKYNDASNSGTTTNNEADDASDEDKRIKKNKKTADFSLTGEQYANGLREALRKLQYIDSNYPEYGSTCRYYYCDYDNDEMEVFAYDALDWKLYGFKFAMNGDNFIIDFNKCKRKKCSYIDFDEGDPDVNALSQIVEERFSAMRTEISILRKFRQDKIDEEHTELKEGTFAQFTDLNGIDAFEDLKKNCDKYSIDDVEEKCFAIRGRNSVTKFSTDPRKNTRIPVENTSNKSDEPYGGIFVEYGIGR